VVLPPAMSCDAMRDHCLPVSHETVRKILMRGAAA
jgi:hypothetical protein